MKRIIHALIIALLLAALLSGCGTAVAAPSSQSIHKDFMDYATLDSNLPFDCSLTSFTSIGHAVKDAYLVDVTAQITMLYGEETFAVMQYEAQLKYISLDGHTELDYVVCHATSQISGFDLPMLMSNRNWVFDPDNNFGHSAARNEKAGLPSRLEWGETPAAGPKGLNDRELSIKVIYSADIENEIKANFYMFEIYNEALGVDFEWDFKMTYASDNGLYLDFLHREGPLDDIASWVLITRPTSSMKAEVVFKLGR